MVPKLLVPPGARIGTAAEPGGAGGASPVAHVNVFDEALLGKSSLGHRRSPAEWLISLGVHAAIVAAVLIVPLFYTQVIDLQQFETTYLAAPPTPAAPPPPPPPAVAAPRQALRKVLPTTAKLTMPIAVPKTVPVPSSAAGSCSLGYHRWSSRRRTWRSSRRPNRRRAWRHSRRHWSERSSSPASCRSSTCS